MKNTPLVKFVSNYTVAPVAYFPLFSTRSKKIFENFPLSVHITKIKFTRRLEDMNFFSPFYVKRNILQLENTTHIIVPSSVQCLDVF